MRLHNRATALLLAILMTLLVGCEQKPATAQKNIVSSTRYIGQARGFLVATGSGGDFPSASATTLEAQQQELAEMVRFAADNKLNSIFFEARPGATAFYDSKLFPPDASIAKGEKEQLDPLSYLCAEAARNKVQVFAVIDPFSMVGTLPQGGKNPFGQLPTTGEHLDPTAAELHTLVAKDAAELARQYKLAGVILTGLDVAFTQSGDATPAVEKLVTTVSAAVKKKSPGMAVGVAFDATNEHNALTVEAAQRLAQAGAVDMVIPLLNTTLEYKGDTGYLPLLDAWTTAQLGTAELYTGNLYVDSDPQQLQNQLLANALQGGVKGTVLAPYRHFATAEPGETELLVSLLAAGKTLPAPADLAIPQQLAITYPQNGATVYDDAIYIMGTSDPLVPLTLEGKEIPRIGQQGTFGVAVPLVVGSNTVTVTQEGQTATVKVNRGSTPTGIIPIQQITTGTLFPTTPLGVDSNATVEIACVGPAGASITATLGGNAIVLAQTTQTTTKGNPVPFKGTVTLNPANYPTDQVTNAGKVTYVTSFGEEHVVQSSEGEVFVAGRDVPLLLEIPKDSYVASVLTDLSSDDNFTQSLKAGGRAAVKGRVTATRGGNPVIAYKLSSGGYILGTRAKIVTDAALCYPDITEIVKTQGDDWEQYEFKGGQPAVLTSLESGGLRLRFLDTKFTADPQALTGGLVKSVERTDTTDGTELLLLFDDNTLWGYDITHGGQSTTLYLRRKPASSTTYGKPLAGISILLDPGHGGPDPGALGVAGTTGPTEAVLNMAVANATKFRLEQLGAQVSMTRVDESVRVSLDERTFMAQQQRPHIFLAIHHNSTALNKDLTNVRRMEAYYWESIAQSLSGHLMQRLTQTMGRKPSDPENAYYYVTRLTFAPAVLFEMGFVVNPAEYEESCDPASIYKAANGIALGIMDLVK